MATARATWRSWRAISMTSVSLRLTSLFGGVALLHLAGWGIMLLLVAPRYPVMLGLGGLAYAFGLRHAFDADHISAIDNTTRKLLQEGKKPLGVGFFFSLGHSTVVFLIALALGFATQFVVSNVISANGELKSVGGLIGTGVSGIFLLLIGILNLIILLDIIRLFRRMRAGEYDRPSLEHELVAGGLLELSQLLIQQLNLRGGVWDAIGGMDLGVMGFVIVGAFIVTWAGALLIYRGLHIEERWSSGLRG